MSTKSETHPLVVASVAVLFALFGLVVLVSALAGVDHKPASYPTYDPNRPLTTSEQKLVDEALATTSSAPEAAPTTTEPPAVPATQVATADGGAGAGVGVNVGHRHHHPVRKAVRHAVRHPAPRASHSSHEDNGSGGGGDGGYTGPRCYAPGGKTYVPC